MNDMLATMLQRVLSGVATGLIIDGLGTLASGDRYSGWGLNQLPSWSRGPVKNALDAFPAGTRATGLVEVLAGIALIFLIAKLGEGTVADDELEEDVEEGRIA